MPSRAAITCRLPKRTFIVAGGGSLGKQRTSVFPRIGPAAIIRLPERFHGVLGGFSMRNSVIQAIRASVLLTFLVLVPFAALFGGSRHRIADARKQAPAGAKAVARIAPPAHRPNRPVTTAIPALTEQQQRLKVDVTPRQPEQPPVAIPGHSAVSADLPVGRSPTPESAHSTPEGGADSTQRSGVSSGDDIPTAAFDRFRLIQDRLKILNKLILLAVVPELHYLLRQN